MKKKVERARGEEKQRLSFPLTFSSRGNSWLVVVSRTAAVTKGKSPGRSEEEATSITLEKRKRRFAEKEHAERGKRMKRNGVGVGID